MIEAGAWVVDGSDLRDLLIFFTIILLFLPEDVQCGEGEVPVRSDFKQLLENIFWHYLIGDFGGYFGVFTEALK